MDCAQPPGDTTENKTQDALQEITRYFEPDPEYEFDAVFERNRAVNFVREYDLRWRGPNGIFQEAITEAERRRRTGASDRAAAKIARDDQKASEAARFGVQRHWLPYTLRKKKEAMQAKRTGQAEDDARSRPSTCIYEIPFSELIDNIIDINGKGKATPGKFRLVDCESLSEDTPYWDYKLSIHEFPAFPPVEDVPYIAISYVWRGNPVSPDDPDSRYPGFNVKGAQDDSDLVGIGLLTFIARCSWKMGYRYLWLDRLCIIQDNREDKRTQIQNMYAIYRHCGACLVLPGGIQRTVPLHEETSWITRAWTLQEAVAPKETYVLYDSFQSAAREGHKYSGARVQSTIKDINRMDDHAIVPLEDLLVDSIQIGRSSTYRPAIIRDAAGGFEASEDARVQMVALLGAMRLKGAAKEQAIWRSALMRTSSRPVDMVFSIMGLFDVTLDTHAYGKNDRLAAWRALAQEILKSGRPPSWLGTSFFLPFGQEPSTFPREPEALEVRDVVQIGYHLGGKRWKEVAVMMNNFSDSRWWLEDMPCPASMDGSGNFTFSSHAVPALFITAGRDFVREFDNMHLDLTDDGACVDAVYIVATDGSVWKVQSTADDVRAGFRTFIVYIGRQLPWSDAEWAGDCTIRVLVIEEHASGRYRMRAWCWLGDVFLDWIKHRWAMHTFTIGTPE
ncbi:uncharacterized protein LAESUDRAFT_814544 [Laetiporus sulphureus 93-53]|uniref:Heterokaryon incompatibility domain-containing protein n=1 Tax=Laetiporus sulphureus 93-53 TaxID=1314785 RepID=A0A165CXN0_9APHY|nr:uncharacterized protein LAESUDRAFT_814544 [Laetiporus sulphureus 93-53]KZT03683.1 hypothetical protein LAESUDRAFT_814544 [Laetiporus sulphureus 93-53]